MRDAVGQAHGRGVNVAKEYPVLGVPGLVGVWAAEDYDADDGRLPAGPGRGWSGPC